MFSDNLAGAVSYNIDGELEILILNSELRKGLIKLDGVKIISDKVLNEKINEYMDMKNDINYFETKGLYDFIEKTESKIEKKMSRRLNDSELVELVNWLLVKKDTEWTIYVASVEL